jgi:hypothetical protein
VESGYKRYGGLVSCLILLILAVVTWASASNAPGRTTVMTNAGTTSRDAPTTTVPTTLPSTTTTVVVTTTTSPATTTVPSTRPVAPAVGKSPPTTRYVAPPPPSSGHNWDAVADCESGGDWHINTGNGFYGGLQFTISSWRGVGGSGMPHQNSREEQIYRGELLLASQGRGAWPVCGRYL